MKLIRTLSLARRELPRAWPLFRHNRVPLWGKLAAVLAAIFIISPLNILGDIPLLGFLDDAVLLMFVMHLFVQFAERRVAKTAPPIRTVSSRAIAL